MSNAQTFGYRLTRAMGTVKQVWDEEAKAWVADTPGVKPQPLFFKDNAWQTVIVATGQKDGAGYDKFDLTLTYAARCYFEGRDATGTSQNGTSMPSAPFRLVRSADKNRAGLAISPETPTEATDLKIFLKNAGLVELGKIELVADLSGFRILIMGNGAQVQLAPNGEIVLQPASGQQVRVEGNLTVNGTVTVNGIPLNVP